MLHQIGIKTRDIDRIIHRPSIDIVDNFVTDIDRDIFLRFKSVRPKMGGHKHMGVCNQFFQQFAFWRFLTPDIKCGTNALSAFKCLKHCCLVNNTTTGAVDDDHTILHAFKMLCIDKVTGFVIEWRMDRDNI